MSRSTKTDQSLNCSTLNMKINFSGFKNVTMMIKSLGEGLNNLIIYYKLFNRKDK